jgi:hypothetical protein
VPKGLVVPFASVGAEAEERAVVLWELGSEERSEERWLGASSEVSVVVTVFVMMERECTAGTVDGSGFGTREDGAMACDKEDGTDGSGLPVYCRRELGVVAVLEMFALERNVVLDDGPPERESVEFRGIGEDVGMPGWGHGKQVCIGLLGIQVQFPTP